MKALGMCPTVAELRHPFRPDRYQHSGPGPYGKCSRAQGRRPSRVSWSGYACRPAGLPGSRCHGHDWIAYGCGCGCHAGSSGNIGKCQSVTLANAAPLSPPRLARSTLGPALASMLVATSIESWLIWLLRSSIPESFEGGVLTLAAGLILAVFDVCSLFAPTAKAPMADFNLEVRGLGAAYGRHVVLKNVPYGCPPESGSP